MPLCDGDFYYAYANARQHVTRDFSLVEALHDKMITAAVEKGIGELRKLLGNPKNMPAGTAVLRKRLRDALGIAAQRVAAQHIYKSSDGVNDDLANKCAPDFRYCYRVENLFLRATCSIFNVYRRHIKSEVHYSRHIPRVENTSNETIVFMGKNWLGDVYRRGAAVVENRVVVSMHPCKPIPLAQESYWGQWLDVSGDCGFLSEGIICRVPDGNWIRVQAVALVKRRTLPSGPEQAPPRLHENARERAIERVRDAAARDAARQTSISTD